MGLLNSLSGLSGIIGGGCALYALFIWKKQIHYNKKLEALEALEKVHSVCTSLSASGESIYGFLFIDSDTELRNLNYNQFKESYRQRVESLRLLNVEFLVKSRMLETITKDKKVHTLKNNVISNVNQYIKFIPPHDTLRDKDCIAQLSKLAYDLGNKNNKVSAAFRNYIKDSLND